MGDILQRAESETEDVSPQHTSEDEHRGLGEEYTPNEGVVSAECFECTDQLDGIEYEYHQSGNDAEARHTEHEDDDDDDVHVQ